MTMAVVVSSSSSIPNYSYKYDVFISFRGEDTRNNFTSYLYDALCENQIETYIDEESLKKGERISELLTAIEESRLSLIVFSKDYAASRWCLDELVKILECKKRGQIVIPIFYHVHPTKIRHQRESYGGAFVEHQKRCHMNKVEEWRNALKEAADLSGFHLQQDHHSEAKFVKKIVKDVLERLNNFPSRDVADDFQGLVGISERLKKIESLLCVGSQDVRIVGIWGMGGIGKTTLAQALYNRFSSEFESCFFTNVEEDVRKHGLDNLMEKMFCKLLKRGSVDMDSSFKDDQLRRRKVLVVLDNVDKFKQLECLVGENDVSLDVFQREKGRFGVGSRVIITSRDKKLLQRKAYDKIYEVDALDSNEAHSLLCLKAFKRDSLVTDYIDQIERVLDYAKGNPLALEVMGSYLHSRTKEEWESALSELKRATNESIQEVLKISYDALDRLKKSIFLDIACFFKGKARDFIEGILGSESHIGINVLIEKSLITIKDGRLQVHDLIQEMGWEIVRQESRNEIAKRSRLWDAQDVLHVLKSDKCQGMKHIEGIFLDMSKIDEDLSLEPAIFEAMSNLRLLQIYNFYQKNTGEKCKLVYLHQGLRYLPSSLRYLNWSNYPSKTLPAKFRPESLVELKMRGSQLKQLWDGVQPLGNLKRIDFADSEQLVKIPDLSHASRLVSVNLSFCTSLVEIPPLNFQNLFGSLDLFGCTNLKILPEISGNVRELRLGWSGIKELPSSIRSLENLNHLDVTGCENLEKLPELPRNIETLALAMTSIREIPAALIDCLHRVRDIEMYGCKRLESLPSNISKLKALAYLDLHDCSNLKLFPQILEPMEKLRTLLLYGTDIREFPSPIENLMGLYRLRMNGCRNLQTIPGCHSKSSCLALHSLQRLNLGYCRILEVPCWIGDLSSLIDINLRGNMFTSIPSSIKKLSKLRYLDVSYCQNLLSLPELPLSVQRLRAIRCMSMEMVLTSSMWHSSDDFSPTDFEFLFCECLRLDQNSVAMDFLCKIIGIGAILKQEDEDEDEQGDHYSIQACYLGKKIPKWIRHQSEGSSTITIKLPPNWHSSNFFNFVTCVVLSFEELYWYEHAEEDYVLICCELHMKTKYGRSYNCFSHSSLDKRDFSEDGQEEGEMLRSDHVFMWLEPYHEILQYDDYVDAVEMSFVFYCEENEDAVGHERPFKYQVKRCGVHLLNIEEEVINEFDMSIQQYVEYMVEAEERGISILQCMNKSEECDQPKRKRPRLGDSIRGGPAFEGELHPRSGDKTSPVNLGIHDGRAECPLPAVSSTSSWQQSFSQSTLQLAPVSQQISPLHMPIQLPQQLPPFLQLHPQTLASYSQSHPPLSIFQQLGQLCYSSGQPAISQPLPSQQLECSNGQLPISQPQAQHSLSSAAPLQSPLNINLQPLPAAPIRQQFHPQQSPSQLSQMLSQQKQALQASFQSPWQAFSQLQQQLGLLQPSSSQDTNQQQQQQQLCYSSGQPAISQPLPSQQLECSNGQLPISQPQAQHSLSSATPLQSPLNINLQPLPAAPIRQQFHPQQSPSQLSQMLSQQKQALQASFQSPWQAFSQLQQQLGLLQPSSSQDTNQQQQPQQQQWAGTAGQAVTSLPATIASADVPSSSASVAPAVPVKCSWTEYFSLDGYKYYYNNVTGEGKREKPEELILYEQQEQQQQKATVLQNQSQLLHQRPTVQQVSQTPQIQFQTQFQMQAQQQFQQALFQMQAQQQFQQAQFQMQAQQQFQQAQFQMQAQQQFQQAPLSSMGYTQLQGVTSSRQQAFQEWMWKNNQDQEELEEE